MLDVVERRESGRRIRFQLGSGDRLTNKVVQSGKRLGARCMTRWDVRR